MNTEGEINEDYKIAKTLNFFIFICPVQENQKEKEKRFQRNYEAITFPKWLQKADD